MPDAIKPVYRFARSFVTGIHHIVNLASCEIPHSQYQPYGRNNSSGFSLSFATLARDPCSVPNNQQTTDRSTLKVALFTDPYFSRDAQSICRSHRIIITEILLRRVPSTCMKYSQYCGNFIYHRSTIYFNATIFNISIQ